MSSGTKKAASDAATEVLALRGQLETVNDRLETLDTTVAELTAKLEAAAGELKAMHVAFAQRLEPLEAALAGGAGALPAAPRAAAAVPFFVERDINKKYSETASPSSTTDETLRASLKLASSIKPLEVSPGGGHLDALLVLEAIQALDRYADQHGGKLPGDLVSTLLSPRAFGLLKETAALAGRSAPHSSGDVLRELLSYLATYGKPVADAIKELALTYKYEDTGVLTNESITLAVVRVLNSVERACLTASF